ncbi:MAG: energy-coupling factor transporter transmembrane protein EcfT [Gammaproteobacteria bacterium]|nr:energy-coupling factor transporter transmembrane protein EcfT [Gammaproteobacteria bacterium]NNM19649.1 hypothetical protein [Gammaproteobacteria bacterium]
MTLKIIYLIALAVALFIPRDPLVLALLLGAHVLLWLMSGLSVSGLWRAVRRLRWFILVIFVSYAFISTAEPDWYRFTIGPWQPAINLAGLQLAALMSIRVLIMVITSAWVRETSPKGAFVVAMRHIGIPQTVAVGVDATLDMVSSGGGRGDGSGGGKRRKKTASLSFASIRSGDLSSFTRLLDQKFAAARQRIGASYPELPERRIHDITVVLTVGLVVMGLKVLQVMPGLPVAPGHKNLLIVPLLLFAARATHMPLGATAAGLTTGIVSFLLGYGKFGVLEISHFVVPGLLADLLMPLARARSRPGQLVQYAAIGAVLGLGRFAANFLVIVLAGAPWTAFVIYLPMLFSQIGFGALSCLVSPLVVDRGLPDAAPGDKHIENRHSGESTE